MKKIFLIFTIFLLQCVFSSQAHAIKIGLLDGAQSFSVGSSHGAILVDNVSGKNMGVLAPMKLYHLRLNNGKAEIFVNDEYVKLSTNNFSIKSREGFLSAKGRWYRGEFIVVNRNQSLTLINDVGLEEYLMGVVPAEMPSKWNHEAHKAQAIAARSYALANKGKRAVKGYDLKDTPEDQAYGGASSETIQTNRAVVETEGIVLTYDRKIISAYYHASSGGSTVNSGEVWSKNLPYLRSVPAFDSRLSKNGHGVGMSQNGANNLAGQGYNAYQILSYFYNNIHFGKLRPEWNL